VAEHFIRLIVGLTTSLDTEQSGTFQEENSDGYSCKYCNDEQPDLQQQIILLKRLVYLWFPYLYMYTVL
jgi:hypothetical protein